jgi:tetratricopeptide (TPR) repeat protein
MWSSQRNGAFIKKLVPVGEVPSVEVLLHADRESFYAPPSDDPKKDDLERQSANYAGAWALVHMLQHGPDPYPRHFAAFLQALSHGIRADEAWADAFGADEPAQLERDFREYLRSEPEIRSDPYTLKSRRLRISVRTLPDADVHLLWARLRPWETPGAQESSRADLDEAAARDPKSPEVHFWRGRFFAAVGRRQDADRELSAAVDLRSQEAHYLHGLADFLLQDAEPARQRRLAPLIERLSGAATSPYELDFIARYHASWHDPQRGISYAERAVRHDRACAGCYLTSAILLYQQRRLAEAAAALARGIDFAPENADTRKAVARLRCFQSTLDAERAGRVSLSNCLDPKGMLVTKTLEAVAEGQEPARTPRPDDASDAVPGGSMDRSSAGAPSSEGNASGKLPPEVVEEVLRANDSRFGTCYVRGWKRDPALAGKVTTRILIGQDGSVESAEDNGSDLSDREVVNCVIRSIKGVKFPHPQGGRATVIFPIRFSRHPAPGSAGPSGPRR